MAALPEIAKNVAEPLGKVDSITMYGEGNSTKLISDIVNSTTQVTSGMTQGLGIDLRSLISGFLGGKVAGMGGAPVMGQSSAPVSTGIGTDVGEDPFEDYPSDVEDQ